MSANKRSYESPVVRLIQFEGNDVITVSSEWWYDCEEHWKGNYMDTSCTIEGYTDNSDA